MLAGLFRVGAIAAFVVMTAGDCLADEVVATAADSGKTVSVHVGQVLTVNLTGSHGSGKYWRLNADLTPELTLSGRSTQAGVALSGAPETTSYSFKTNSPGTLAFKASYMAAGAPIPTTNDVEFTINVLP
jgi:predicted secreted protein